MGFKKNLKLLARLAWRNVWKNKRRTVLTLLTITAGSSMVIFMRAFQDGGYEQMIEDALAPCAGHIQIHEKGFWENMSIDYAFRPAEPLLSRLKADKKITGTSERIHAAGLLSYRDTTSGALIQAVDPASEIRVTTLHKNILKGGRYLAPEDRNHIIMGHTLAKNLGVKTGGSVSLISQGFDGSIAAENLTVVGLFRTGNPEYDRYLAVMPLEPAKETFTMMGYVSSIAIRLEKTSDMEETRDGIKNFLGIKPESAEKSELEVMGWDELLPEVMQHITMDIASSWLIYVILFLIVAFGILNTIQMSVFERTREFGIMKAIGTRPGQILGMIVLESIYISLIGAAVGIAVGSALGVYFQINPLDFSEYSGEMELFSIASTILPTRITLKNILSTSAIVIVLSVLFTIPPARRAARLKPLDAIRQL